MGKNTIKYTVWDSQWIEKKCLMRKHSVLGRLCFHSLSSFPLLFPSCSLFPSIPFSSLIFFCFLLLVFFLSTFSFTRETPSSIFIFKFFSYIHIDWILGTIFWTWRMQMKILSISILSLRLRFRTCWFSYLPLWQIPQGCFSSSFMFSLLFFLSLTSFKQEF